MPRVGNIEVTSGGYHFNFQATTSDYKLYATPVVMPEHGFITSMAIYCNQYQNNGTGAAQFGIWGGAAGSTARAWSSAVFTPPSAGAFITRTVSGARAASGSTVYIGLYAASAPSDATALTWRQSTLGTGAAHKRFNAQISSLPASLDGSENFSGVKLAGYFDYVANTAPLAGEWQAPTPLLGSGSVSPTFAGTTPHSAADSGYGDYTSEVHLVVWRASDGAVAYDNLFATTQAEKDGDYFERSPVSLIGSTTYRAKYRHRDSFGVYSPYSPEIEFTTVAGPNPPNLSTPSGKINTLGGYNYTAVYTHPDGLGANMAEVEVWNATGTTRIYPAPGAAAQQFMISVANGATISLAEWHADLSWATNYTWTMRVRDTANGWSEWATKKAFKTDSPPDAPTLVSPVNNITTESRDFSATATDPDADPIASAVMEIVNADTGAAVLHLPWAAKTVYAANDQRRPTTANGYRYIATAGRSGPTQPTWSTTSGSTVRDNAGIVAVARSTAYAVGAAVLKPAGTSADAEWYEATAITGTGTTAATAPAYPTTDGATVVDGEVTFTTRKTVVWTQNGLDSQFAMTVGTGGAMSLTVPSGVLINNTNYRWRAAADDGLGPGLGAWSGYEFFRIASVPVVTMLTPAARTNLVRQPSAEYNPATLTTRWTETARTVSDYIDRVTDEDAAYGTGAWQGLTSATGDNRALYELTAVDATKAYVAKAWMKKKAGTSASHFAVRCYDGAGMLLATVYPSSVALANGADVPVTWTEYGGIIWPAGSANSPAFPAGTTQVRHEITPSRASAATVRYDAVTLEQVPVLASADWTLVDEWYGYGDPNVAGYGAGGYTWTGVTGDSAQSILPVLSTPPTHVAISYSSAAALAKKDDRILIDRWDGVAYTRIHDTGYPVTGSARTIIPVPSGVIKNEGRYRMKVMARDTANAPGETTWIEFDVRYQGVPELNVLVANVDPLTATLNVTFELSTLTALEFAGIEIAREATDGSEPFEIVDLISDPAANSVTYHYPRPGIEYRIKVRQIKNVGADQAQSRWTNVLLTCDYSLFFVKDVDNPAALRVAYDTERGSLPTPEVQRQRATLLAWGTPRPTTFQGENSWTTGEAVIELYDGPEFAENAEARYRKLVEMFGGPSAPVGVSGMVCLLSQSPKPFKVFASPVDSVRLYRNEARVPSASFGWVESNYSEDYYKRNA